MAYSSAILASKILIVDDNATNIKVLKLMLLQAGYLDVTATTQPVGVCALHQKRGFDLILLDIMMPEMDGFQVMEALSLVRPDTQPSILVITAQPDHKLRAMRAGAKDFVSKPFDHSEVLTRIHYMLEVRLLQKKAENYSTQLEETVNTRTAELRRSERMFRELVANIPEALWIKDVDRQTIEYVNPAWVDLNGLQIAPGEPIAKGYQTIHPDDFEWLAHERRIGPSDQSGNEYRLVRPDQSTRWVHTRSFSIANPAGPSPLIVEIIEDVTQRKESQHQLLHLTRHDTLTGIPNRTLLYESLRLALRRSTQGQMVVSVLLIDIDHFKKVNDTSGHAIGDALLREFAQRLSGCVRPGDTIGRLGGDEFAIVIQTSPDAPGAINVADRIRAALKVPFLLEEQSILITASIGIASTPPDASDLDSLIRCADIAMYEAKASGRNAFCCYTAQMNARATEKLDVEGALRFAQLRNEFVLHYQPKMQIRSGKWTGVEALIRWNRPGHGIVLPGLFVPALEDLGLIVPVGAWVIDTACRQIRDWQRRGLDHMQVAVNVSSRQVREAGFASQVAAIVKEHGVDPTQLEFEITESTLMGHDDATDMVLAELKNLGISISIDDFGTGYSSLAYLKRFPVNALKIDMAFIRDVTTNPDDAAITIAIIKMAQSLRLKVIAEGVETSDQLSFLRVHGCDEAQGYYVSKPLPADDIFAAYRDAAAAEHKPLALVVNAT